MVLSKSWRVALGVGAVPGAIVAALYIFSLEESPRWQQARDGNVISPTAKSPTSPLNLKDVHWMALFLGVLLAYTNNSIDACLFYGPRILSTAGSSKMGSIIIGLISNAWCVLAV